MSEDTSRGLEIKGFCDLKATAKEILDGVEQELEDVFTEPASTVRIL